MYLYIRSLFVTNSTPFSSSSSANFTSLVGRGAMIMEGDHDDVTSSSSSSLGDSSSATYDGSSTSSLDFAEDASSFSSSGPLFEFSELMANLPIKRGLSKFYVGKSQSFTSLSRVKTLEDLAKRKKPSTKRLKGSKSNGGGMHAQKSYSQIFKKVSTNSPSNLSFQSRRGPSFMSCTRLPPLPVNLN